MVGGTSGIGRAVARMAAERGAEVLVASRSAEPGRLDAIAALPVDVTTDESVERLFAELDRLDHLICTAASGFPPGLLRPPPEDVRALMESKFWGQYRCVRAAHPIISPGGSVTLTSGIRSRRPQAGAGAFTVVNNAVEGLARALAQEMAPVRVNAVSPGTVRTPVFDVLPPDVRERRLAAAAEATTVGRIGEPEEVAEVMLMCATNPFLSGAVIDVDGGGLLA